MLRKLVVSSAILSTLGVTACGGKRGTIELDIVVSPTSDPFAGSASSVQFTIGKSTKTVGVSQPGGHFSFSLEEKPPKSAYNLTVEVLDSTGKVLGFGQTPPVTLNAVNQGPFGVWVGKPNTISAAATELPSARTDFAGCGATGLGALFAGGHGLDSTGAPIVLSDSAVYDVFTSAIIPTASMSTPRAGASAIGSLAKGIFFGGATSVGSGSTGGPTATAELFDPSSGGTGIWASVPTASGNPTPTSYASSVLLGSGDLLVAGGANGDGSFSASASLLSTSGTVGITGIGNMIRPRMHHAVAPATFSGGDGALLVGGLADDDTSGAIVEKLIGQQFSVLNDASVTGVENRWDATATSLTGGVLLVGGTIPTGGTRVATNKMTFIQSGGGAPTDYTNAMMPARAGHTATMVGTDILLCGGWDETGKLRKDCDLLATNPIQWLQTINGLQPRKHHVAVALETGPVLLAGGEDDNGTLLKSIDIYTPIFVAPPATGTTITSSDDE